MAKHKRTHFKDLKSFKSWREALDEMQEMLNRASEFDADVSDRLAEIIFHQDLNNFNIRLAFTAENERRKKL